MILKNENKTTEMVEILGILYKFVLRERSTQDFDVSANDVYTEQLDHFSHVLIGGDQLTAARIRGAHRVVRNSNNGQERLEGLVPVVEDWHAKVCFLQVRSYLTMCVSCIKPHLIN